MMVISVVLKCENTYKYSAIATAIYKREGSTGRVPGHVEVATYRTKIYGVHHKITNIKLYFFLSLDLLLIFS